ncbi:D-amino-acid transaminase [Afifella pfennigii]|uniref:D-amino-acid transaminase n=1 Tax=Afifella pfennigii TaxID=209897 RepID=UPI00047E81FF|nr:D-amino-acid transaminase [Afifella pfennigii]
MSRVAYVNGRYVPHRAACVHIEDRGYQFADGVYEVCEIWHGHIVDMRGHLDRLERSLDELEIAMPMTRAALRVVLHEVARRNRVREGLVYVQVTRGVAPRDHVFPGPDVRPSIVVTARSSDRAKADRTAEEGIAVITVPDNRWERVDIKSVGLLPNAIARQRAKEAGAKEAWFVDDEGFVTEGAATTAWIVTKDGTLVTRPNGTGILPGITRRTVEEVARRDGYHVEARKFTPQEAKEAREAFITAATTLIMPIVTIDGTTIANGKPGSVATAIRQRFHQVAELEAV